MLRVFSHKTGLAHSSRPIGSMLMANFTSVRDILFSVLFRDVIFLSGSYLTVYLISPSFLRPLERLVPSGKSGLSSSTLWYISRASLLRPCMRKISPLESKKRALSGTKAIALSINVCAFSKSELFAYPYALLL